MPVWTSSIKGYRCATSQPHGFIHPARRRRRQRLAAWPMDNGQRCIEQQRRRMRTTASAPMTTTCRTSRLERGAGEHDLQRTTTCRFDSNGRFVTYSDDGGVGLNAAGLHPRGLPDPCDVLQRPHELHTPARRLTATVGNLANGSTVSGIEQRCGDAALRLPLR